MFPILVSAGNLVCGESINWWSIETFVHVVMYNDINTFHG